MTRGGFSAFMMSSAERCSAAKANPEERAKPTAKVTPAKPILRLLKTRDSPVRARGRPTATSGQPVWAVRATTLFLRVSKSPDGSSVSQPNRCPRPSGIRGSCVKSDPPPRFRLFFNPDQGSPFIGAAFTVRSHEPQPAVRGLCQAGPAPLWSADLSELPLRKLDLAAGRFNDVAPAVRRLHSALRIPIWAAEDGPP